MRRAPAPLRFFVAAATLSTCVAFAQTPTPDVDAKIAELQRRYEARIDALETEVKSLRAASEAHAEADRAAAIAAATEAEIEGIVHGGEHCRGGRHVRYDGSRNPAIGVFGDFLVVASDKKDAFDDHGGFRTRGAELEILGRVDRHAAYQATFHFLPDEIEFEEGFVLVDDGLPFDWSARAGKFFYDFGKLGPVHDHELPFVDKPAVYQDYFGGSPSGIGVEFQKRFEVGDVPVRFSFGAVDGVGGDTVAIVGPAAGSDHDEDGAPSFGRRGVENLAFHARVAATLDLGASSKIHLGASALRAPEIVSFVDDGSGGVLRDETDRTTIGFDFTYRWSDPSRDDAFTAGVEILRTSGSVLDVDDSAIPFTTSVRTPRAAWGGYAYAEYAFDKSWSAGGFLDLLDRLEDPDFNWTGFGAFVTWRVSETQRLRLQAQVVDDELLDDRYVAVMLQWTVLIGSHSHLFDW
jgi:hypothetical protein